MADENFERVKRKDKFFQDEDMERALRDREIVEDTIKGAKRVDTARKFGLSLDGVAKILKEASSKIRENIADRAAEVFMLQEARLERLYSLVEVQLQRMEAAPDQFDDRPFRIAVMLFDRQAKLFGTDKSDETRRGPNGWLNTAPIEEVVAYAQQLKMKVPTQFET